MSRALGPVLFHYSLVPVWKVLVWVSALLIVIAALLPLALSALTESIGLILLTILLLLTFGTLVNLRRFFTPMAVIAHENGLEIVSILQPPTVIQWPDIALVTGELMTVDLPHTGRPSPDQPDRRTVLLPPYYLMLRDGKRVEIKGEVRMLPLGLVLTERTLPHLIPAALERLGAGEWIGVHPQVQYSGEGVRVQAPTGEPHRTTQVNIVWRDLAAVTPEPGAIRIQVRDQRDIVLSTTIVSNFAVFLAVTALIKQKLAAPPDMFSRN